MCELVAGGSYTAELSFSFARRRKLGGAEILMKFLAVELFILDEPAIAFF